MISLGLIIFIVIVLVLFIIGIGFDDERCKTFVVSAFTFLIVGFFLGAHIEKSSIEKSLNIEGIKELDK
jgi:hypothetical protein